MSIARPVLSEKARLAAGQRDYPVCIEQLTQSKGPSKFPVETWTTLVAVEWMGRTETRANERFSANQLTASTETAWHALYRADMDPDLVNVPKARRLVYENRIYDISAASIVGQKQGLEFLTIAKVQG